MKDHYLTLRLAEAKLQIANNLIVQACNEARESVHRFTNDDRSLTDLARSSQKALDLLRQASIRTSGS